MQMFIRVFGIGEVLADGGILVDTPRRGLPLAGFYVRLPANDEEHARTLAAQLFGHAGNLYDEMRGRAIIERGNLKPLFHMSTERPLRDVDLTPEVR